MTAVMQSCDPGQTTGKRGIYREGFSGTGAQLGWSEDGDGLAIQVEDAIAGEAGEGAREGLARDARRLRHLLAGEGWLEDDATLGHPSLLGSEVQEHTGDALGGAAE